MHNLKARHYFWLHFKLAIATWTIVYGLAVPAATLDALGVTILIIWESVTVTGAILGGVGLVLSEQQTMWASRRGPQIEVAGLSLIAVGPLLYFTTQLSLYLGHTVEHWEVRLGPAMLGYALLSGVLARLSVVLPRYRSALKSMETKDA